MKLSKKQLVNYRKPSFFYAIVNDEKLYVRSHSKSNALAYFQNLFPEVEAVHKSSYIGYTHTIDSIVKKEDGYYLEVNHVNNSHIKI